jgi:hypothetical protein
MTHTVTLLADHKGFTKPRANGDEYMVDAALDITSLTPTGEVITASSLGLSSISSVVITGSEGALNGFKLLCAANGAYTSNSSFTVTAYILATGAEVAGNAGTVRVRAFGLL